MKKIGKTLTNNIIPNSFRNLLIKTSKKLENKLITSEKIFLLIFFLLFIFIRSFHFSYFLNWSQDQAEFAIEALKIYREKKLTLIGPQISTTYQGRLLFQGPITYYLFLIFLFFGNWDPIKASYLFMIFAAFSIFPLYFGTKKLINQKAAFIFLSVYSFLPYFINYTRFLWNSTLQLSLLPYLIYFLSNYYQKQSTINFFIISFFLGLLSQFHYQFLIIVFGFFIYFLLNEKNKMKTFFILMFGMALGLSPLLFFEIRHNFYNLQTAILFLKNWSKVDKPGGINTPHYYLSLSFFIVFSTLFKTKKILRKTNIKFMVLLAITLFFISFFRNIKKPNQSYWAPAKYWNYPMEEKAYQIIKQAGVKENFNVADLSYYNTKAAVIKYFLIRDNYQINYDDYYQNRYLFVIAHNQDYEKTLSYEVAFFKPRKLIKKWNLNHYYHLYLFERVINQ